MPIPSRVLAAGNSGIAVQAMCGVGATGLTATGSTSTDALQLSADFNTVATTAAGTGVRLPPTEAGALVAVYNAGANTLAVYPASGSTINAGATSLNVTSTQRVLFIATSATTWISIAGA